MYIYVCVFSCVCTCIYCVYKYVSAIYICTYVYLYTHVYMCICVHQWMTNASRHTHEWHLWTKNITSHTQMNESYHFHPLFSALHGIPIHTRLHSWMSHVTSFHTSYTNEWVMSLSSASSWTSWNPTSHTTSYTNESCHLMSSLVHTWMRHVTSTRFLAHFVGSQFTHDFTHEEIMPFFVHIWKNHVTSLTHIDESRHVHPLFSALLEILLHTRCHK